ncbi:MAG: NAD(P)/FAD-dependent oxidoreductase, partial [Desulfobacteraceae bacterium]|nr:NAD(P)/FAD-dependent oxidoreductase [Desulfobacteraceae bacterium]
DSVFSNPKIDVRWNTDVKAFMGEDFKLKKLRLINNQTGLEDELPVNGAFIFIGLTPNTGFLKRSGVRLDQWGFVVTGHDLLHAGQRPKGYDDRDPHILETSIPGIFAAGDVRDKSTKQVASAAGEGASAALMIREFLRTIHPNV